MTGSKNKSRRTYQLSSGTDGKPEKSRGLSTEQKTKKKKKMATDNLELRTAQNVNCMESCEDVAIVSSCTASRKSKMKIVQVGHKEPANNV